MDVLRQALRLLHHELGRQRLIRERHVHHARRVPLGRREVDQPAVGQHEEPLAVEPPLVHELPHPRRALRRLLQALEVDLHVEVTRVGEHRPILHRPHVLHADDIDVARQGDEHVAHPSSLGHRDDPVPVHLGLERLERVDLGHEDVGPRPARPHREAAAAPPIPRHHHRAPRDEEIRRPQDPVQRGLARAVTVVEQVLRVGIVHRHHRELEHAVPCHCLEADHARGGLLRRAEHAAHERLALGGRERLHPLAHRRRQVVQPVQGDHVQRPDQVGPVVQRDVGPVGEGGADVLVIGGRRRRPAWTAGSRRTAPRPPRRQSA